MRHNQFSVFSRSLVTIRRARFSKTNFNTIQLHLLTWHMLVLLLQLRLRDSLQDAQIAWTIGQILPTTPGWTKLILVKELFLYLQDFTNNGVLQVLNNSYYLDRLRPLEKPKQYAFLRTAFMNQKIFCHWLEYWQVLWQMEWKRQTTKSLRALWTRMHSDLGLNTSAIADSVAGLLVNGLLGFWYGKRKRLNYKLH